MPKNRVIVQKKRQKKNVVSGVAHISCTFNNTTISITDMQGNVLAWSTAGVVGFSGSRQSTPHAAQVAAEDVSKKALVHGLKNVEVWVKGPGSGRDAAIKKLSEFIVVTLIRDVTSMPFNGCRPPKARRV